MTGTSNRPPSAANAVVQSEELVSAPGPYLVRGHQRDTTWSTVISHEAAVNNVYTALMANKTVTPEDRAVTIVHNNATRWVQTPIAGLAERYPVDSTAVYVPEEDEDYRDVVIVKSGPDAEGKVEAVSGRYNGKTIRVVLDRLHPMPTLTEPGG